jgi:phage terminase large subunit-like protein
MTSPPSPTPHPILPVLEPAELARLMTSADGPQLYAQWFNKRERLIELSIQEPYLYGFELPHWKLVDELWSDTVDEILLLGGNRAAKSEYAAKRTVQTLVDKPRATAWCLQTTNESSIEYQQPLIWKYLPSHWKAARKTHVTNISYSVKNGFADGKFVGPNGSICVFKNYAQKRDVIEGGEVDMVWADELIPLDWVRTLRYRIVTRKGRLIVSFTPIRGFTPAVKEYVDGARTVQWREADLLPATVNVPGGPVGMMPLVQVPVHYSKARVVYFHSVLNPFGGYPNLVRTLEGKPTREIKERAYGYAEKGMGTAFPRFAEVHIIEPEHVPAEGTNHRIADPAGARNWFVIWWRCAPDGSHYIYREWPDEALGEWAVPSDKVDRHDGDPGPAQQSLGFGPGDYKKLFLRLEKVGPAERDAQRRRLFEAAGAGAQEVVFRSIIDPRAGRNQHASEKGGICLIDRLEEETVEGGKVVAPSMVFEPASGVHIDEGITEINSLLYYDPEQPLTPLINAPRLYVSRACRNTIWALQTWTGHDGDKGACKDPVDCVRYGAMSDLMYVNPRQAAAQSWGGY